MLWPTAHQPVANYAAANHGPNYVIYGQHHDNLWHNSPPPAVLRFRSYVYLHMPPLLTSLSLKNSERQYFYETDPNIGHPTPGNAQHMLVTPGPSRVEYEISLAHVRSFFCYSISCYRVCLTLPALQDIPGAEVIDYSLPPTLDVTDAFSRSVPESVPSEISAKECLKRLADRYLNDPGSQVDTLRMGPSPSEGRLKVMIVLHIDI